MKRSVLLGGVLATVLGLSVPVSGQGPFAAQIVAALRVYLSQPHVWTGAQSFTDISISGVCNGCDSADVLHVFVNGTSQTLRPDLNFVGANLAGTDDSANGRTVVTLTPGGNQWDVQFKNSVGGGGGFAGNDAFQWNNDTLTLSLGTALVPAHLVAVNADLTTPSQTGSTNAAAFVITAGSSVNGSSGSIDLTGGTKSGTSASGASLNILGGGTEGSTIGGWITGVAGSGVVGGTISLTAGVGTGGLGGNATIVGGDSGTGGGTAILGGGNGTSGNANGGSAGLNSGFASGSGSAGTLDLVAGNAVDGVAGSIQIISGLATGMGTSGSISLLSRSNTILLGGPDYVFLRPPDDFASFVALYGSAGVGAAIGGGAVFIHGGAAASNAAGGDLFLAGGSGEGTGNASGLGQLLGGHGANGATGGDAEVVGGNADGAAKAGDAYVTGGVSDMGTNGNIILTTAGNVTINGTPGVTATGFVKGLRTGPLTLPTSTVMALPTCNGGAEGQVRGVTDALLPAALGAVATGGAVHVPVYCNGTAWIVF